MAVRRILAALATLAAPLPLLVACGGGGDSVADPPISSGPTSAPTAQHRESPEHFIRRWAAEEKRMENTGDTSAYVQISGNCSACMELVRVVKRYYARGGFIRWDGLTVLAVKRTGTSGSGYLNFHVKTNSRPTEYREAASSKIQRIPGGISTEQVTLKRRGDSWQVEGRARVAN